MAGPLQCLFEKSCPISAVKNNIYGVAQNSSLQQLHSVGSRGPNQPYPKSKSFSAYCPDRSPAVQYGTTTSHPSPPSLEGSRNFPPVLTGSPRLLFSNSSLIR